MFWLVNWLISSISGALKQVLHENVGLEIGHSHGNLLYGKIPIFFFAFNKKITTSYTFVLLAQRTQFRCVKKQRALWFLYDPHWYLNICIICLPFFCMTNTNIILTCIWWYTMRCVWTRSEDKTLAYIAKIF